MRTGILLGDGEILNADEEATSQRDGLACLAVDDSYRENGRKGT